jgi:hypothetical protein
MPFLGIINQARVLAAVPICWYTSETLIHKSGLNTNLFAGRRQKCIQNTSSNHGYVGFMNHQHLYSNARLKKNWLSRETENCTSVQNLQLLESYVDIKTVISRSYYNSMELLLIKHFAKWILYSFNAILSLFCLLVSVLRLSKLLLNTGWVKNLLPSLCNKGECYCYLHNTTFLTFWAASSSPENRVGTANSIRSHLSQTCIPFNCKYSRNYDLHLKDDSLDFLYVKYEDITSKVCGPSSSVGIVTGYGLAGLGIESRWARDFLHTFRLALGPSHSPVQWVPGLFRE